MEREKDEWSVDVSDTSIVVEHISTKMHYHFKRQKGSNTIEYLTSTGSGDVPEGPFDEAYEIAVQVAEEEWS